jgi:hypothetical protein
MANANAHLTATINSESMENLSDFQTLLKNNLLGSNETRVLSFREKPPISQEVKNTFLWIE